jgi:hypothetical protein
MRARFGLTAEGIQAATEEMVRVPALEASRGKGAA